MSDHWRWHARSDYGAGEWGGTLGGGGKVGMDGDRVEVWLIPAELPGALLARLAGLLDATERRRLSEIVQDGERRRFLAAHGAARSILAPQAGVAAADLRWVAGVNGKPRLADVPPGLHVNLSHSGDLCLLAVAGRPVGVDVQQVPSGLDPVGMAARRYPAEEAAFVAAGADATARLGRFVALWARKEACVKAAGGKLMQGMGLPVAGGSPLRVALPGGPLPGPFVVTDLPVPDGYGAAVAVSGDGPYHVLCRAWPTSNCDGASMPRSTASGTR
jgi:4'-phosphopantetheinyl transferase